MRFSEAWLRELVNPSISTAELVEQLTMAGLEVDSVEPAAAEFSNIVIGEVVDIQPHPDADKLQVCKVDVGDDEPLQIVCGASNARLSLKAPTALLGAVLPGDFKIKKSKLRGELSFGMLCSEKELGLAADADGLMELSADAPVGTDICEYMKLKDSVIEVDLTPNRADCLSVEGIAREVAVLNKLDWSTPSIENVKLTNQDTLSVKVDESSACPRYLGRLVKGVNPVAETPLWMRERLRRSGLRSLGPLVDVTNYVLLEMGQPLHAFDAAKISGGITVRNSHAEEELELLNNQCIRLDAETLVISDDVKALALAGVMGGSETAVSDSTKDVFIECAFFAPDVIMGKARQFGLHTDSSHRFERGVDPFLQHRAIERATQLIIDIAGGSAGPINQALTEAELPVRSTVILREDRVAKILGVSIPGDEVQQIFTRLGMSVKAHDSIWEILPPGFRFDIAIEADLIEELGRIYGYNNLPQSSLLMRSELAQAPEAELELDRIKDLLVDRGYQEAITYSFVDAEIQHAIAPNDGFISLQNPISSELSVMRTTLWCGLLQAAQRNVNRQQNRVRLFESGLRFVRQKDELRQEKMLAGLILGNQYVEQWGEKSRPLDFFDLKGDVEALFALTGRGFKFVPGIHNALHPGQTADILTSDGEKIGHLGLLHPTLEKQLGFDTQVFLFELEQQRFLKRQVPSFITLSRFPIVRRDLALSVNESVSAADILSCIVSCREEAIKDTVIFDVYRGKGVEEGYKSVALSLIIQNKTQTLTDAEIDAIVNRVLEKLTNEINGKLRD